MDRLQALFRSGVILGENGRPAEALAAYDKVLSLRPDHVEALNNRGYTRWQASEDYAPSNADLERAVALAPDLPFLPGGVLHLKMQVADWSSFAADKMRLIEGVRAGKAVARPFMFQALSDSPADSQACARIFARTMHPPVAAPSPGPAARKAGGRIRLGYLSGEFREQATAILMAGLYERHDRSRFEVIALDNGSADASAMSARLKKAFDQWIDSGPLDDVAAAERIRAARIDILVNLNGWFGKPRMGVFAQRPAPVQVNYLGFPGTLGAPYIDYIIADRTVMWLLKAPAPFAENIAARAAALDVGPERILYAPHRPPEQHLARMSLADLFLDQLPYNAHTTGSDALWAGLPLLTLRGTTFPGRVAASLLQAAGLPELVTESAQDFETLAVRLATHPKDLAALKSRLTRDCPLFDTDLFRRRIEAAYLRMWEAWQAGQKPRNFAL
ncbi:MAG: hypothetical protein JF627_07405 [Alphaproteobacteria bacterium]|nr:hypothetical protein [Alphaproteobacteria bacterium]